MKTHHLGSYDFIPADLVNEENRLKEMDRTAVQNTPPPTLPAVPLNPCEG